MELSNISFFTWLLTGGVMVVYLLNGFFAKEDFKYRKKGVYNDTKRE